MNDEYHDYIEKQRKSNSERLEFAKRKMEFEIYRSRKITLYGILFTIIGITIILTKELLLNYIDSKFSIAFVISGVISFAVGVGSLLYKYLQTGTIGRFTNTSPEEQNLRSELHDLRIEILKLRKKSGAPLESENISETINKAIDETLTDEFIKSQIDNIYSDKAISESKRKNLLEDFEKLSFRINGELSRLRRSANLNLVIGTLTTALAIIALGYEVFNNEIEFSDTVKLLTHYLPRLSLIVFIEIFAFFFLKLYKATLADIKYFNNEKTNIDFKLISLKTALNNGDSELIKMILQELVKTERNFKLLKDESTVEIEKLKNDSNNNQILAQLIEKLKNQK